MSNCKYKVDYMRFYLILYAELSPDRRFHYINSCTLWESWELTRATRRVQLKYDIICVIF